MALYRVAMIYCVSRTGDVIAARRQRRRRRDVAGHVGENGAASLALISQKDAVAVINQATAAADMAHRGVSSRITRNIIAADRSCLRELCLRHRSLHTYEMEHGERKLWA
jgi:hypothetical protein